MYALYQEYLEALQHRDHYRRLSTLFHEQYSDFLDFSTNDYLNLSQNRKVVAAALETAQIHGVGSTGSRLLSGNLPLHEAFERAIANDKGTEAALIFNSGFQANISTLSSLLDEKILRAKPLIFFDRLNHSSLYQAVFLSGAELCRYRHNDMNHLESLLEYRKNDSRPKFIVTETVFGMDGDVAPLEQIVKFARQYNTFLYLDEAHATGVFGTHGYGLSTAVHLDTIPHVIMGTLSKAIGCSGGYIACHAILRDFLINRATGFIYSTAPSPMVMGAAFRAWKIVRSLEKERVHVQNLGNDLRTRLQEWGFDTGYSTTHIVPIILKTEKACLEGKEALLKEKIIVSSVRPPTVPSGSARLRVALTAQHQQQDLERLVACLENGVQSR